MDKEVKDYQKLSIELHKKIKGKIDVTPKLEVKTIDDLSTAYSPGIAGPCLEIQKDESLARDLVSNAKMVAVVSDGSAVLGLGNIGPKAALPVMEGKAVLFKNFGGINAFPIVVDTQDTNEIIDFVEKLAPSFGGINLEDISAPRCFEIEEELKKRLDIPVFHDDQHGTAIVVLAGIINSLKLVNKKKEDVRVVINGSGAAGVASAKLLHKYGFGEIVMCDSKGVISRHREDLKGIKLELLTYTNPNDLCCMLPDVMKGADIFIGVSKADLLIEEDIKNMNRDPIIFGLANPNPEIKPEIAKEAGAKIIATGRSDYPNQINNVLVFPGIFKGAIEANVNSITDEMKIKAAESLAALVKDPSFDKIIPGPFDEGIADAVADAVISCSKK